MSNALLWRGSRIVHVSQVSATQRIWRGSRSYSARSDYNASSRTLLYALMTGVGGIGAGIILGSSLLPQRNTFKAQKGHDMTDAEPVPAIEVAVSADTVDVSSPVQVLSLCEANDKLREGARAFEFSSGVSGNKGRVDLVRVASNLPVEDEWAIGIGSAMGGQQDSKWLYAGIYDGHAGWATSTVLRKALIRYVSIFLGQLPATADEETITETIQGAFEALDTRIMEGGQRAVESAPASAGSPEAVAALAPAISGSCALLAIFDPATSMLRTAVTGDSRAVLGSWSTSPVADGSKDPNNGSYVAETLTQDQTGFNVAEVARLVAEHPGEKAEMLSLVSGRLFGLAVTRAFGDHRIKWSPALVKTAQARFWAWGPRPAADRSPPYLTARPEVTTRRVQAATDFVILASDGLWDVMSSADAVTCVERWLAARRAGKPETAAAEPCEARFTIDKDGYARYKSKPDVFAIEDLDNAAVCLAKNAFGGRRRDMFRGMLTAYSPISRHVRDDVTIQVIFFQAP